MRRIEVLAVASEIFPLIKTGGLADVVGSLPAALAREKVAVRTLVPGYPAVLAALPDAGTVLKIADLFGGPARLLAGSSAGLDVLALDAPHLFARPGDPYSGPNGREWPDNAQRFAALSKVGADVALGAVPGYAPDLVHAHDWQAGLTFAYLHFSGVRSPDRPRRPATVMTIHNLAFQGTFPALILPLLGLPAEAFAIEGIEYHGAVSYLKAGLHYADRITTVSPSYAAEIRTPEQGMGLDGLLRARGGSVTGILNGIDIREWDPRSDLHISSSFDAARIDGRAANKADLQSVSGLDLDASAPLFGVVSRLTWQKGLDMLLAVLPSLLASGGQVALLGSGDADMEAAFRAAAVANPRQVGCVIGYDEGLAHRIQAGADILLVPSRFEPCGLTQLYALRYGAVPLVARVGGLSDTVIDANPAALGRRVATGVQFAPATEEMLRAAIERTITLYRQPAIWRRMQANGMACDVSWRDPARRYAALFHEALGRTQ